MIFLVSLIIIDLIIAFLFLFDDDTGSIEAAISIAIGIGVIKGLQYFGWVPVVNLGISWVYVIGFWILGMIIWGFIYWTLNLYKQRALIRRIKIEYDNTETSLNFIEFLKNRSLKNVNTITNEPIINHPKKKDVIAHASIFPISIAHTLSRDLLEWGYDTVFSSLERLRQQLIESVIE